MLKKIIRKISYNNYAKSYSQCGEDLIINFIFRGLKINRPTYLDIGSYHPHYMNNTYLFYKKGGSGVCVEPNVAMCSSIRKNRKRDKCLNVGISVDESKEADFYIMSADTLNTFSKEEANRLDKETSHKIKSIVKIPTQNINEIIKENFKESPNFISIDVEGSDYDILKSFDFDKFKPEVFCIETLTYSENKTEKKINRIMELMEEKGYFVYGDTYINTIFVNKELWLKR